MSAMHTPTKTETETAPPLAPEAYYGLRDARHLRQLGHVLGVVGDEVPLDVEGDGLHCTQVDAAHVCMVEATLKPEGLEAFQATRPGRTVVNVDRIQQAGSSFSLGDPARIRIDGENGELSLEQGRVNRKSPLGDEAEFAEPNVPELRLPGEATVPDIGELEKFVRYVGKETADNIVLRVDPETGLTLRAIDEAGEAVDEYHAPPGEVDLPLGFTEGVESRFSVDYLASILKAAKKLDTTTDASLRFHVGRDFPLRARVETEQILATYTLAPRIGDD